MNGLSFKDGLSFDIYIIDLCEKSKPKSCEDLEELSQDMHKRIEMAIEDYIDDSDEFNRDDYNNQY